MNGLSEYIWLWGQFITHEIDFTTTQNGRVLENETPEIMEIPISYDDPWMGGAHNAKLPLFRSVYVRGTGTSLDSPREHPNNITAWIDGSVVYGSNNNTASWLRTFEGGRLKITDAANGSLLPIADYSNDPEAPDMSFAGFRFDVSYVAGDARANEHIGLMAMHVLWVREHNRLAELIQERHKDWQDEDVYQRARKLVSAQIQSITYNEFLPAMSVEMPSYNGYDSTIQPTMTNGFATLAFRMGHSQISNTSYQLQEDREPIPGGNMALHETLFSINNLDENEGIDPILRGLAWNIEPDTDTRVIDGLRNMMFGRPGAGGQDMCAIDIQRGRDHGIPDYNTYRNSSLIDLPSAVNWSDITSDLELQRQLASVYNTPDQMDALIGMLAEDREKGKEVGPSLEAILSDQFHRLRVSDPLFYLADSELAGVRESISDTRLADVILRNTNIRIIQCDVFFAEKDLDELDCASPLPEPTYSSRDEKVEEKGISWAVVLTSITIILIAIAGSQVIVRHKMREKKFDQIWREEE